jgi:hypothetical protein
MPLHEDTSEKSDELLLMEISDQVITHFHTLGKVA